MNPLLLLIGGILSIWSDLAQWVRLFWGWMFQLSHKNNPILFLCFLTIRVGMGFRCRCTMRFPVQRATFIRRPISRNSRVRACAFQRLIRLRPSVHQRDAACKRARVRLRTVGQRQPQLRPPQMAINSSRRCMGKISPMVRRQLLKC